VKSSESRHEHPILSKHTSFIIQCEEPFNGNAPLEFLCQEFITDTALFFVRNHGDIPAVDLSSYRLTIDGLVENPTVLTLEDLKQQFESVELTVTLQCAGNRRDELMEIAPIPNELPWSAGAISNARWGGVRLSDVLKKVGVQPQAQHVAFTGLDQVSRLGKMFGFGGSIPLEKALKPESMLVYAMNGEPLSPEHGLPLRTLIPGYIGARSVKWLSHITLQTTPSDNYFQARAYRLFPPDVTPENVKWETGIMLGENTLNSVICHPSDGDTIPVGATTVLGYAVGGENPIAAVEVSADGGQTWTGAEFLGDDQHLWAWRLWQAPVIVKTGEIEIVARAKDALGNTQPRDAEEIWNFKGYANNAWHRIKVRGI
jgi:sulfite oxidase